MRNGVFKILMVLSILVIAAYAFAAAQQPKEYHKKAGVECTDCHETKTPNKGAEEAVCLNCHGSREDITKLTEKIEPNPHFGHEDGLTCNSCHREHEDSILYCDDCHQWGLTTP